MVKRKTAMNLRKIHRYLGIFIGIQFVLWTVGGLYFSWTDIDEIHGDQFKKIPAQQAGFNNLKGISALLPDYKVNSVSLKEISGEPYYFVNHELLINAETGEKLDEISEADALNIAGRHMKDELQVKSVEKISEVGDHHEYRGGSLPAYVISYEQPGNLKAYVSAGEGDFQAVRYRDWRWFDFLWMMHTMDYQGRDDINNLVLRSFSVLGLFTVLSGFVLWFISSPTMIKAFKKRK
ncbi:hypothetical protein C7S20_02900 [Christiangramia fulva]|uniref:PepSY domain-containing protein n=1 Tax=Christiangramia fulva TaxID=2126553 RepID=A0A2R3ZAH2_9FLAO|nr:PepSY domain-containing protein [Christiangramia fulva]AVR47303.1 hypothetical protein C7S20_02900 [Christiangramia fulva]